jgi:hypothetical protein
LRIEEHACMHLCINKCSGKTAWAIERYLNSKVQTQTEKDKTG